MQLTPKLSREQFIDQMRAKVEELLGKSPTPSTRHRRGRSSRAAKNRSAISSRTFAGKPSRPACRCDSTRRKPLFPPPKDLGTSKSKRNKGSQDFTVLTINGRARLWRRRWYSPGEGTTTPLDQWLDAVEGTISLGVREMACRLNGDGENFDKAAANLARTAQVTLSGETLRVPVETEGKRVVEAQRSGRLPVAWSAADCPIEAKAKTTRLYFGSDGVMVPLVTDAEKASRRHQVQQKRQQRGSENGPLPPARKGADQRYKEFKIVAFYDERQEHRLVAGTRGDHEAAGQLMRREAGFR